VRWYQENFKGHRNPLVSFIGIAVKIEGGDVKIPQVIIEGIQRHPSLFRD